MPIIQYKKWRPTADVAAVVDQIIMILEDPEFEGLTLTLRQLYYQFIARKLFSENTEKQYKRLGRICTDAREAGLIDWYAIEDRGRACYFNSYNDDPAKVLEGLDKALGRDPWQDQDVYLECWIEKQSLEPMLARPARMRRAPYMACKGYLSASEAWRAGMRFEKAIAAGKRPVLIHLGDHDPSGWDMTRDNGDRLGFYSRQGVEVLRVALNRDQIDQYKPPEMPSKTKDSREKGYRAKHGTTQSWELDALKPSVMHKLILDAIDRYRDPVKWEEALKKEREMREESGLGLLSARWQEVHQLVRSSEQPLARLALLDEMVPKILAKAERVFGRMPAIVEDACDRFKLAAVERVSQTEPSPIVAKDKTPSFFEGYDVSNSHAQGSVQETPAVALRHEDDVLRTELHDAGVELEMAMVPVPFVAPDLEVDNEYEPKDPDEEEQERFGDEPVKGDR